MTGDLLGVAELAALLGVQRVTVSGYVSRGVVLPPPAVRLACGPIWHRADIEAWIAARDARKSI